MARLLMVQGTASNVGKSIICAALCRWLREEGWRVAPFKAQNMALNAMVAPGGGEMSWAQVMQAEAAGAVPSVSMNPVLLKPVSDSACQVIVNGRAVGNMEAREYQGYKKAVFGEVIRALGVLSAEYDAVILEGAGSPAEINLRENDIVNMGLALPQGIPVMLVADIDRGGAFAAVAGTLELLATEERELVKGIIINKFRGQKERLQPGLAALAGICGKPVAGVLPYLEWLSLPPEDSLDLSPGGARGEGLDVAVVALPRIANFTDYHALATEEGVSLRYVDRAKNLGRPHLVILPGSKNTLSDLQFLRQSGLAAAVREAYAAGSFVVGVCGGYQMLGEHIHDADGSDGCGGKAEGLGLLPVATEFRPQKTTALVSGCTVAGGHQLEGYEIHLGRTRRLAGAPFALLRDERGATREDGTVSPDGRVLGTYLHGLFDCAPFRSAFLAAVRASFALPPAAGSGQSAREKREESYRLLAEAVRRHLDTKLLLSVLEGKIR